jgi:hypothetical protein
MSKTQHAVTIHLIVKANTLDKAKLAAQLELSKWLNRDRTTTPGYGYPDGSLLLYRLDKAQEEQPV